MVRTLVCACLFSAATPALARPYAWTKHSLGVAAFPTGTVYDAEVQVRLPILREGSVGAGLHVPVSPAYAMPGLRVTFEPGKPFVLYAEAALVTLFPAFGALPYDTVADRLGRDRKARRDEYFGALGWAVTASPALRIKGGPIVILAAFTASAIGVSRPDDIDAPYYYNPQRGLILAWTDVFVGTRASVLGQVHNEDPLLLFGLTVDHKRGFVSADQTLVLGFAGICKPVEHPAAPRITGEVGLYLDDADRGIDSAPRLALQLTWELSNRRQ